MKKWIAVIVMLALLLAGCAKEEKIVVDFENHTISDGTNTYEYTDTTEDDVRTLIIHYPDGGRYIWTQNRHTADGRMEYGEGISRRVNGHNLAQAVLNPQLVNEPEEPDYRRVLMVIGIVVVALGLLLAFAPTVVWNILLLRRFQENPSDYALSWIINNGKRMIFFGLSIIFYALFA